MISLKNKCTIALIMTVLFSSAQTIWKVDGSHSKMGFSVIHMMVSESEGKFKIYEGSIKSKSETDFTDAQIEFSVDVNSVSTDDEKRDAHLKSPDFFDAEKFPKMTFKVVKIKPGKVKGTYDMVGDLTIKGVTKKENFSAIGASKPVKDPSGNIRYAFKIKGNINRMQYGLRWNTAVEAGGVAVSEAVKIDCTIELIKG